MKQRCPMESFIALLVVAIALSLVLVGCTGWHEPQSYQGLVCGKVFTPAHWDSTPVITYVGDTPMTTYDETYVQDSWAIIVSERADSCVGSQHDLSVSRETYDNAKVGSGPVGYRW